MRVYKYPVPIVDVFALDLPRGAQILSFHTQDEQPTIWALVDDTLPDQDVERRQFELVGTGHPLPTPPDEFSLTFIGTVLMAGGALVWHLFEMEPVSSPDQELENLAAMKPGSDEYGSLDD